MTSQLSALGAIGSFERNAAASERPLIAGVRGESRMTFAASASPSPAATPSSPIAADTSFPAVMSDSRALRRSVRPWAAASSAIIDEVVGDVVSPHAAASATAAVRTR